MDNRLRPEVQTRNFKENYTSKMSQNSRPPPKGLQPFAYFCVLIYAKILQKFLELRLSRYLFQFKAC